MTLRLEQHLPSLVKDSGRRDGRGQPFALKLRHNGHKQNVPSVSSAKVVGTKCVPDHSKGRMLWGTYYLRDTELPSSKFSLTTVSQFEGNRWTRQKAVKTAK